MRILSLSGFVPEHICDTIRFTQYTGDRNISHYCGYVSDYISQVMQDDSIDGAVFPKSCDSTRTIRSYLSKTGKFLFQMPIPAYGAPGAKSFLVSVIKSYRESVAVYYGVELNDTIQRIYMINKRNESIKRLYANLDEISYSEYISRIHHLLGLPLSEQNDFGSIGAKSAKGKKVLVVGSFLSNVEIAKSIEEAGLSVVGDTLPESGRIASSKVTAIDGDVYENIADYMLSMRLSPTQNSFKNILDSDKDEMLKKSVKGILFITQKYCEPYDYLFSPYKAMAEELGLKVLKISLNDTEDSRKVNLSLEAFADTL